MINRKYITKEEALKKLKHYCAYQERCHSEVKEKLYGLGLYKADVEELISVLIEENYLNEERFSRNFAGGKFRMNNWGHLKISYALQQKKVSAYCIEKALKEIAEADYEATLLKLASTKWTLLKSEQHINRKAKTYAYLLQKGYETELINKAIAQLNKKITV